MIHERAPSADLLRPPPITSGLPSLPPRFVERDSYLRSLERDLARPEGLFVLTGACGVGKTALALAAVNSKMVSANFDVILWAELGPQPRTSFLTRNWARDLGVNGPFAACSARLSGRRILIVLDDLWRGEDFGEQLKAPAGTAVYLVITSFREVARHVASPGRITYLPFWNERTAGGLLSRLAPELHAAAPEEQRALVAACGGLPAAEEAVGTALSEVAGHPALRRMARELLSPARRAALPAQRAGARGPAGTLGEATTRALARLDGRAQDAFRSLGVISPGAICPQAAVLAVVGGDASLLEQLVAGNLVELRNNGDCKVNVAAAATVQPPHAAWERLWSYLQTTPPTAQTYLLAQHSLAEPDRAPPERTGLLCADQEAVDGAARDLAGHFALYQRQRRLWEERRAWLQRALAHALRKDDDRALAALRCAGGHSALHAGDEAEAREQFRLAMDLAERAADDRVLAQAANDLARLYFKQERFDQARDTAQRAQQAAQDAGYLPESGRAKHLLARCHLRQREYEKALELLRGAESDMQRCGNRTGQAAVLHTRANLHCGRGHLAEARQALEHGVKLCQENAPQRCKLLIELAGVYRREGKTEPAVKHAEEALDAARGFSDRLAEAEALDMLASLYEVEKARVFPSAQQMYDDAVQALLVEGQTRRAAEAARRVAQERAKHAPPAPPLGGDTAGDGDAPAAPPAPDPDVEQSWQRALDLAAKAADPPTAAETLAAYAGYLHQSGRMAEACAALEKALAQRREVGDRKREAATLDELGKWRNELGEEGAAESHWRAALKLYQELAETEKQARVCAELGTMLARRIGAAGDEAAALDARRAAVDELGAAVALARGLPAAQTLAAECSARIARIHRNAGKPAEAEQALVEAVALAGSYGKKTERYQRELDEVRSQREPQAEREPISPPRWRDLWRMFTSRF